ncbi:MAG: cytochrome c biogenesis heme-transporting ATPase CcmA [Granulosicoccus sp.]
MTTNTQYLLEARGIQIWRGEHLIVDDVDVCVSAGSIVQIQGSNGSGKTTLLRALIGLAEIDDGEVFWQEQPVSKVRDELYASLLYLGHKPGITAGLTPFENLTALCPELSESEASAVQVKGQVLQVLSQLGIGDRIDLPSAALSAGQQRRVSLARLQLQQATLWVLDEPLTSLDAQGQRWVKQQIEEHVTQGGAVVFTTHQPIDFDSHSVFSLNLASQS